MIRPVLAALSAVCLLMPLVACGGPSVYTFQSELSSDARRTQERLNNADKKQKELEAFQRIHDALDGRPLEARLFDSRGHEMVTHQLAVHARNSGAPPKEIYLVVFLPDESAPLVHRVIDLQNVEWLFTTH